jgi:hypothetical protein
MCWVCFIFFAQLELVSTWGGSGEFPQKNKIDIIYIHFLAGFQHMIFFDGFLILVKESGLLTNLGKWIRGFWMPQDPRSCPFNPI